MKGDFSRFTFDETRPYSRVLMQQGRVLLDADWNESAEIQTYYLRALARDLIGPHGAPTTEDGGNGPGFNIGKSIDANNSEIKNDFSIDGGHYYVQGILCRNDVSLSYRAQADWPDDAVAFGKGPYLVYLDVWERHITPSETGDVLADPALGGADTCSRARVVWQVKTLALDAAPAPVDVFKSNYQAFLKALNLAAIGRLSARVNKPADADSPCLLTPESRFRGTENQLYRVEIRHGSPGHTFVWSRENGSEIYPIDNVSGAVITLTSTGRDDRSRLQPGDYVELVDDTYTLRNGADPLLRVTTVSSEANQVTLSAPPLRADGTHRYLRRWNSPEIDIASATTASTDGWIDLEDGVQVKFDPSGVYATGEYWTIPARTATGDVIWPQDQGNPAFRDPQGVRHAYAPLGLISFKADRTIDQMTDLRRLLIKSWK